MHMTSSTTAGTAAGLPGIEEIRTELDRILSSREFPGTGRAAAFLRYVVEETLAGRANRLKGYSIAIEVFGRDETFTQDDPVVRIEAGRLRRSLERYYLVEGDKDPIRIDIPKGGYTPAFSWNAVASATPMEPLPVPSRPTLTTGPGWRARGAVLAGVAAVLAASAYWIAGGLASGPTSLLDDAVRDMPTLVVAPFANLDGGPDAQLYSVGLTEELLTALPRFKEIKVFGRETSKSLSSDVDASKVREALGARYLLAGGVRTSPGRLRVTARLLDTADGEILWSRDYDKDLASGDLFAIQTDVARRVATAIAQPYGVMAQVDAANPPPDDLGAYECTLRFYAYRSELSAEAHAGARTCLETTVERYPTYSTAWAMLSIMYLDEDRFNFNPEVGAEPPLQRALKAARRATQLDGNNTRGLQALMMALFFNKELTEAMRVGEQALATNPNDTELMGELGTRMALAGEWQRGAALLDQAIALNPAGGGFYHGTRALAAYMLKDNETAVREITKANMQKFPLFHAVAAVIYAEAGMMEAARREGDIFAVMQPDFLQNIIAELTVRNVRPEDRSRLMAGLRKAGLTLPQEAADAVGTSELQPR
ncbi:adenylate cyclase [Shinella sp.]|uniref:adenylate cyclase n=1 Tax=Shinella sp. TaxID=1870904 RepID=UPI003F72B73F